MVALYQKRSEVEYRPCLEPDKRCCRKDDPKRSFDDPTASYHWSHRYTCYKRNCSDIYDFSELCFLCNEWVSGSEARGHHCQDRLRNLDAFLVYCDPPTHGGVLATAGYCPSCLTNARLPARMRMYQFLNRGKWLDHIQKHVQDLNGSKPAKCLSYSSWSSALGTCSRSWVALPIKTRCSEGWLARHNLPFFQTPRPNLHVSDTEMLWAALA